jgi:hypothetical protein
MSNIPGIYVPDDYVSKLTCFQCFSAGPTGAMVFGNANKPVQFSSLPNTSWNFGGSTVTGVPLGAAEFVHLTQSPNNSVAVGQAFTYNLPAVYNSISSLTAAAAAGGGGPTQGTLFTLPTGLYYFDYEMSLGSSGSVAIYKGPSPALLSIDTNTIAGSATATSWIHGRALVDATQVTSLVAMVGPANATDAVVAAGDYVSVYMCRLNILKIA